MLVDIKCHPLHSRLLPCFPVLKLSLSPLLQSRPPIKSLHPTAGSPSLVPRFGLPAAGELSGRLLVPRKKLQCLSILLCSFYRECIYNPADLQTPRLRLRPFTMEDANELFCYASDAEFSKYLDYDAPKSENDAIGFLRMVLAGEMGTNLWAMTLTEKPGVIGAVQFNIESSGVASLHYEIARWLWGRGLASEAVAAVLDWAKTAHPEIVKVHADTHIENAASRRVLEKFGFKLTTVKDDSAYYVLSVSRSPHKF